MTPQAATRSLSNVLARPDIWRGKTARRSPVADCGLPRLRPALPDGGWPVGALTEVLSDGSGSGDLAVLMPALARLSREQSRWVLWVGPPHIPYPPALAQWSMNLKRVLVVHAKPGLDTLWAMSQALRSGTCSAVLGWAGQQSGQLSMSQLRQLQLAAEQGGSCGFLFRPPVAAQAPSAAALRIATTARADGVQVQVLKRRGSWAGQELVVKRASLRAAACAGADTPRAACG